jgi:hypothetical protein
MDNENIWKLSLCLLMTFFCLLFIDCKISEKFNVISKWSIKHHELKNTERITKLVVTLGFSIKNISKHDIWLYDTSNITIWQREDEHFENKTFEKIYSFSFNQNTDDWYGSPFTDSAYPDSIRLKAGETTDGELIIEYNTSDKSVEMEFEKIKFNYFLLSKDISKYHKIKWYNYLFNECSQIYMIELEI